MANQLNVETLVAIYRLAERGWSNRGVARLLNVNRGTVAKYGESSLAQKGIVTI